MTRALKIASFWRENVIVVVGLRRVLARMAGTSYQMLEVFSILGSGEGVSLNEDNSANFYGEKLVQ